jgi:hypothetical protein
MHRPIEPKAGGTNMIHRNRHVETGRPDLAAHIVGPLLPAGDRVSSNADVFAPAADGQRSALAGIDGVPHDVNVPKPPSR